MELYAPSKYLKKVPNQSRSKETVSAIIQACAQIVAKEGNQSLTTENIARVAGVSVGSIYQYFETKDAIILAMLTEAIAAFYLKVQDLLAQRDDEKPDVLGMIPVLVDAILAVHGKSPEAFGALLEYLALQGELQAVEFLLRDLEGWTATFLEAQEYVSADQAALRARSLVHGICAIVRTTLRYEPASIGEAPFRRELERLLYVLVFRELPADFGA